jgi:hypothetical protein
LSAALGMVDMAEGELMLAFDMRIRAWIDSMTRKP